MKEKEIIRGKKINILIFCIILVVIGFILGLCILNANCEHDFYYNSCIVKDDYYWSSIVPYFFLTHFGVFLGIAILIYFWFSKIELVVTNKRVYGKVAFGKRIDLPFDMISSIGTCFLKGVCVSSPSGIIRFRLIKNNLEVHQKLSEMLNHRVDNKNGLEEKNEVEELKKYKELLDINAITQEEYDKKKKELLKL